jgi:hypothetical protein
VGQIVENEVELDLHGINILGINQRTIFEQYLAKVQSHE